MAIKTNDLVIDFDLLETKDNDITYTNCSQNAIYFKGKAYDEAIASTFIEGDDFVITTKASNSRKIIFKDYFKQNGKNSYKYIKTDEAGETGHLLDIINSGLLTNPTPITEAKNKVVTGTVFGDTIDVSAIPFSPTDKAITINSNQGNDTITGTAGIDTVNSGAGDDIIYATKGNDVITGGVGTNTIVYNSSIDNFGTDLIKLTNTENLVIDLSAYGFSQIADLRGIVAFNGKNLEISLPNGKIDIANFVTSNGAGTTGSVKAYLGDGATDKYVDLNFDDIFHFGNDKFVNGRFTGTRLSETISANNLGVGTNITTGAGYNIVNVSDTVASADRVTGGNDGNNINITKDGNKTITTGIGADNISITGNNGTFTVNAGAGDNVIIIDGNARTTVTGGKDVDDISISNNNSQITINAGAGNNVINIDNTCTGASTVNTGNDNDVIIVDGSGNTRITSGAGSDFIMGGYGNDVINAGADSDTIYGGGGNDTLTGGAGSDTFIFMSTDGSDVITDAHVGDNMLQFTDIYEDAISFYKTANDLQIKYTDNDKVTIKNYFTAANKIDALWALDPENDELKKWSIAEMLDERKYIISGKGAITGTKFSEIIEGSDVKDTINALAGDDIIYAGAGNDVVNAGDGNDIIYGEAGNDTLTGGNGDNTIVYNTEDFGNDIVNLTKKENLTFDFSQLAAQKGWSENDFTLGFSGAANKDIRVTTTEGSITINNFGRTDVTTDEGSVVLKIADDNTIDLRNAYYMHTTTTNYTGNWHNEIIDAKNAPAARNGISGVTINAALGDDVIYGSKYNDTLTGGLGTNTIIYDFMGFGEDTVNLTKLENLILDFSPLVSTQGWSENDFNYSFSGSGNKDLLISTAAGNVRLNNFAKTDVTTPDGSVQLALADDNVIDLGAKLYDINVTANYTGNRLNENISALAAPVGKDGKTGVTINAGAGDDTVTGSLYNDTITTGLGNNTVVFSGSFGTDTLKLTKNENLVIDISAYPEYDTLKSLQDITTANGANLEITVGNNGKIIIPGYVTTDVLGTGSVTIKSAGGYYSLSADVLKLYIDERNFVNGVYNGTRFDEDIDATWVNRNTTINAKDGYNTIIGTNGYNDIITGGKDGNSIIAKDGNKTITTGAGDDYVQIDGDGVHTINLGNGMNTVQLTGSGVTRITAGTGDDTIVVSNNNAATTISAGNGENYVEINNSTGANNITTGAGNDTVVITTSGSSIISTGAGDDQITLSGNYTTSTISSGAGNDTIISGEGNDNITGGAGNDIINAGAGENRFYFNNGDGNDIIANTAGLGARDTVIFQAGTIFSANYDDDGNIVLSYGSNYKNSVTLAENGNVRYMQVGNNDPLEFWDYVKTLNTGDSIGSTNIGAGSQRFLVLKNSITGETLTYDIQNTGESAESYSFTYLTNGRLLISGNNLKVLAKSGQADNIIVLGDNNYIDTGDGDDYVRVGLAVDGGDSYRRESNNNTVITGVGDDHVTVYGEDNTITLGAGTDSLYSVPELSENKISGNTPLYTYVNGKSIPGSQDGRVEMFSQGHEGGDCRLLALLDSLYKNSSVTSLYEFVNIQNRNGSYTVRFNNYDTKGGLRTNTTTVSTHDIANWNNVYGDLDVVITDIALNKLLKINHDYGMDSVQNAYYNTLGNYLFGENLITCVNTAVTLDFLWSLYQSGEINNLLIGGLNGQSMYEIGYITGHQYSIVDVQENYVTLVNPWNNMDKVTYSRDMIDGSALYVYGEDVFNQGRILPNADGDIIAECISDTMTDEIMYQIANWTSLNNNSGMADIASTDSIDNVAALVSASMTDFENADIMKQYA